MRIVFPAILLGAVLGTLAAHPLPPDLGSAGAVRAVAAPVRAMEDFFDARDGIGVPCAPAETRAVTLGGVALDVPACWETSWDAATQTHRMADPALRHYDVAVSVLTPDSPHWDALGPALRNAGQEIRRDAWEVRRMERTLGDGRRAFAWVGRTEAAGATLSLAADREEVYSPKLRAHLARVEAAARSLRTR